jgi:Tol biopolymer transport system component/imidazolonepropionase-like amidohydrolase
MIPRVVVSAALVAATAGAQYPASTRQVDLTISEGTSMAAAVSPDRRWIAIDLLGSLWVLPMSGGDAKKITPDLLEARQPTWSSDSRAIAFQGYDTGTWHLYVVGLEGEDLHALTSGEFDDREPAWSHDGRRIAFSSDRFGGISTIWELNVGTGELGPVSRRDGWMPTWAPDDQEITFVSTVKGIDGGGSPPAASGSGLRGSSAPSAVPSLWAIDANGRERLLARVTIGMPAAPAWSPDGALLAYTLGGRLIVGGRPASADEDVFPFRPQWVSRSDIIYTADGHIKRRSLTGLVSTIPFRARVSLQRTAYPIAHRPLETTGPRHVTGVVAPMVSPDGRAVAFVALGDVWVMPVGGRPVPLTNDAASELDPAWSPDGGRLAFSSDRTGHMELWVRDLSTGVETQITKISRNVSGAAWSPDGNHVAFLIDRRQIGVATVQADAHHFTDPGLPVGDELGRPTWSADNHVIAVGSLFPYSDRFREGLNQVLLFGFDPAGISSTVIFPAHSAGNRENNGPVWSPDGFRMAFVSEGRLWTVSVDASGGTTGLPTPVADDQPSCPSWEGDGRHLVYQTPDGLRRVLADGSASEAIPIDLSWTPRPPPERLVVHAGHVFDGLVEGLRGESDIIIERGIVREIGGHRDDLHAGAVVDASRETVIPGLIDMHAHLDRDYGADFGRVWLAYGVTTVRLPAVNPYAGLEQREAFEAGRRPGPRLFLAGDPFDGARVYYPGGVSVTSEAQLEHELDRAAALDVDLFKTYVRLPDRYQQRVVEYAHALGKPVTSHELYPAVAFGIDGIEHLRGTSRRGYSTKVSPGNRAYADVIDLIAKSGVTLTPTIGIQGAFDARIIGDRSVLFDSRLSLYPTSVVSHLTDFATMRRNPALDVPLKPYEAMLKGIAAAGGKIVAGTDSPIVPYGLGLHVELESYVHAGLTPFDALQTATIAAAQALGVDAELGTIEPGKIADLTFIGGDPLLDIRNTRDVKRVMKGGRLYAVEDLVRRR